MGAKASVPKGFSPPSARLSLEAELEQRLAVGGAAGTAGLRLVQRPELRQQAGQQRGVRQLGGLAAHPGHRPVLPAHRA